MCGICGYMGAAEEGLLESMVEALSHRGPDDVGYYRDGDVGLGHRRLSIIDVSGGHQPIENEDGSLILICNGEIYNYQELRTGLLDRGHRFRTNSDSEVILHLFEERGVECLHQLNGMFAVAIYDRNERRLFLARDRLGIKPLYYAQDNGWFLFASEFKSILRFRRLQPTLNMHAIGQYLRLRFAPGPSGMLNELRKLPAGYFATVRHGRATIERYWQPEVFRGPFPGSEEDYLEGFAEQFERSIQRRLISEVPVGAYLSGGLDSSTIVAATAGIVSHPIRTFSIGFDFEHDELADAAATAEFLGCSHTEISCRVSDVELLPEVIHHLDQPIGDPIIIPTYLLAREAKKQVTVVLTGEGADEILGGYLFHKALLMANHISRLIPRGVQDAILTPAIASTPAAVINKVFDYPASLGKRGKLKILDFLRLMGPDALSDAYHHLISLFDQRDTLGLFTDDFKSALSKGPTHGDTLGEVAEQSHDAPYLNRVLDLQFRQWLPDLILMRQDKLSMANAVEARVPFLDHELVEYGLRIPPDLKIRRGKSKYLLRRYAERLLPRDVASRRKMPFYFPLENYFSDPYFQELLHDTLSESSVRSRGIFRPEAISKLCRMMRQGEFVFVKQVFSLVALELWLRVVVDRRGAL